VDFFTFLIVIDKGMRKLSGRWKALLLSLSMRKKKGWEQFITYSLIRGSVMRGRNREKPIPFSSGGVSSLTRPKRKETTEGKKGEKRESSTLKLSREGGKRGEKEDSSLSSLITL